MFPVEKKADWRRVRKKREMRASVSVKLLYVGVDNAGGSADPFGSCSFSRRFFCAERDFSLPFGDGDGVAHGLATGAGLEVMYILCSILTQVRRVTQKVK